METTIAESEKEKAWRDYVDARNRAVDSDDFQAGILAGKAWGRFIRLFEEGAPKQQ